MRVRKQLDKRNPTTKPLLTLVFCVVFGVVYATQLLVDGSLAENAGFRTANTVKNLIGDGVVVLSWLLHSNHSHFIGNMVVFLLAGWWVENRVDNTHFVLVVGLILGISANVVAAFLGEFGVGASGITTGLVTMVALGTFGGLFKSSVHIIKAPIVLSLSVVVILMNVGVIGALPAGTAVNVHILGALFGAAWFGVEKLRFDFSYSPTSENG